MNVLAIINPASGSASPEAVEAALAARFPDVVVHRLAEGEDPANLVRTRAQASALDLVIASGGDGTVGSVASALRGTSTELGIVPTGTANVLAHELMIPFDVEAACDVLVRGMSLPIDVMSASDRTCLCRIAFGLIGEVGQDTTPTAKRRFGGLAYAWNALPLVLDPPALRFELEVDGRPLVTTASCVIVANAGLVGWGEMRWGPTVRMDDGKLDVLAVHTKSMSENLRIVWDAVSGDVSDARDVSHFRAERSVKVRTESEVAIVADGEPMTGLVHEIRVEPRALSIRVPRVGTT